MLISFRPDRTRVIVHGHALRDKRNRGVPLQHHEFRFLSADRSNPEIIKRQLLRSHHLKRENDLCICRIVRAIVRCRNGKPAGAVRIIVRTSVVPFVNGRSRWKWIRLRYRTRNLSLSRKWSADQKPANQAQRGKRTSKSHRSLNISRVCFGGQDLRDMVAIVETCLAHVALHCARAVTASPRRGEMATKAGRYQAAGAAPRSELGPRVPQWNHRTCRSGGSSGDFWPRRGFFRG
jgi:hypothetical protein